MLPAVGVHAPAAKTEPATQTTRLSRASFDLTTNAALLTCSACFSLILQLLDMGRELPHAIALRPPSLTRNAERFWAFIIQCFFLTLSPGTTS